MCVCVSVLVGELNVRVWRSCKKESFFFLQSHFFLFIKEIQEYCRTYGKI